ncbi:MarR family winged helix-turn-helix transcriptional regulator [Leucobacter sp. HNU]|uniref:MarR family winged helix-turn-helix transcriptional regulator n=1 Tax=Leucobacter sp. HNU TaxID=3236805 RepID=UPI003A7FDC80
MAPRLPHSPQDRRASVAPELLDFGDLPEAEAEQALEVMAELERWQRASRALAESSAKYMRLNETDMRAIRMIMRAQRRGEIVTPKDIARETGISSASTTKLVDRLVDGGHLTRTAHPNDRRTVSIRVTDRTRRIARDTIGRQHTRRLAVAAAMSPAERATVIAFLAHLSEADDPQSALFEEHPASPDPTTGENDG